jgi:hypothetical protein
MALGDVSAEVPDKMIVKRPKGDAEVATVDMRRFYRDGLVRCDAIMDDMKLPRIGLSDVSDNMRGPGAGLMTSNEHLFDVQVCAWFF